MGSKIFEKNCIFWVSPFLSLTRTKPAPFWLRRGGSLEASWTLLQPPSASFRHRQDREREKPCWETQQRQNRRGKHQKTWRNWGCSIRRTAPEPGNVLPAGLATWSLTGLCLFERIHAFDVCYLCVWLCRSCSERATRVLRCLWRFTEEEAKEASFLRHSGPWAASPASPWSRRLHFAVSALGTVNPLHFAACEPFPFRFASSARSLSVQKLTACFCCFLVSLFLGVNDIWQDIWIKCQSKDNQD